MNRRDFLLFRTDERQRVVELSCERLYMQYLDAQLTSGQRGKLCSGELSESELLRGAEDFSWGGEPPAVFEPRTPDQLFGDIESDLATADVLRVTEPQWLTSDDLERRVETLLESFRARGGKIEYVTTSQPADDSSSTTR